ncbi:MAG: TIGR03621 family F420-dependent LLM class oxidoreductase [Pseudomonadota bacterium]
MPQPFRFAVQSFNAGSGAEWSERARRVEALGYSALHVADHILGDGPALERSNHPVQNLAAVPAMCFAAAATSTLKIGARVFCIDYRLPVMLVKEALTIDLLSEGRLEFGLGAGWLKDEYDAIGLQQDSPGRRIERLGNAIAAFRQFAGAEPVDVDNADVRWAEFQGLPKAHDSRAGGKLPPLMIGGGAPRILRLAGREADIVSLNFNNRSGMIGPDGVTLSTAEETDRKLGWIREGAGARFAELEIEVGAYFTVVTDTPDPVIEQFAGMFGLTPEQMGAHPHALFGSPAAIADELRARRERFGISYVTVPDAAMDAFAPVVKTLAGS